MGGFKVKTSNSSTITYMAEGGLLSAGDYDDESQIERCLAENCDYAISAVLVINKLSRDKSLTLHYDFNGKSVKYSQFITDVVIYTEEEIIKYTSSDSI